MTESSRLRSLEKFLANNFALSDAEDNTSRPLNRGGIEDLTLLWTLLALYKISQEPSFWEGMNSFALVAYASLAGSRTCLKFEKLFLSLIAINLLAQIPFPLRY